MANPHAPIDQLFNHDMPCADPVLNLVERSVVLDRVVVLQGSFRLNAENRVEINVLERTVQVFAVLRRQTETPVIAREIGSEEAIGLR